MERFKSFIPFRYCLYGFFLLFLGSYSGVPGVSVTPSIESVYISQVGVRESTGRNDGYDVEKYLKSVKSVKGNSWCAAFVHWCLVQAEIPNKVNAWSPTAQNNKRMIYRARQFLEEPRAGDVFCLYYPKLKRIGHTGFFHSKVNLKVYESVEGNTNMAGSRDGDGVYKKYRSFNATYSISRWEN